MTSYTTNIPQPGDDPSDSQDQILQNFQTLNSVYGSSGDHYPWTNTTPTEGFRHAKVTLPSLPTANPPGNVVPTPAANEDVVFVQTVNSQTYPFLRRDSSTVNYSLLPFKAYGMFQAANPVVVRFLVNCTGVSRISAGLYEITFDNAMPNTNYGVLTTIQGLQNRFAQPVNKGTTTFRIAVLNSDGTGPVDNNQDLVFGVIF